MNTNKIKKYVFDICHAAHDASKLARRLSNSQRNKILSTIISQLDNQKKLLLKKIHWILRMPKRIKCQMR